jgi:hypothetical protein
MYPGTHYRTPSRCSIASWSTASSATLRAPRDSRSTEAPRNSTRSSPPSSVGHRHTGLVESRLEPLQRLVPAGVVRDEVVVVERHGGDPELGEPVDRLDGVERWTGRRTEDVDALPSHGPEAEAEAVVRLGT